MLHLHPAEDTPASVLARFVSAASHALCHPAYELPRVKLYSATGADVNFELLDKDDLIYIAFDGAEFVAACDTLFVQPALPLAICMTSAASQIDSPRSGTGQQHGLFVQTPQPATPVHIGAASSLGSISKFGNVASHTGAQPKPRADPEKVRQVRRSAGDLDTLRARLLADTRRVRLPSEADEGASVSRGDLICSVCEADIAVTRSSLVVGTGSAGSIANWETHEGCEFHQGACVC